MYVSTERDRAVWGRGRRARDSAGSNVGQLKMVAPKTGMELQHCVARGESQNYMGLPVPGAVVTQAARQVLVSGLDNSSV